MICAYAICPADAPALPPPERGLGGTRLTAVRSDGLAAVCSRHRTLRPRPTPAQVLVHERVVEAVMARSPVLPFRFGTVLPDADRLAAVLDERRDELLRALTHVRGRVELAVRALPREPAAAAGGAVAPRPRAAGARPAPGPAPAAGSARPAPSSPTRGRDHLLARVERQRAVERVAAALHGPLAALAVDSAVRERPAPPALFVGAYLVDAAAADRFRARAAALAGDDALAGAEVVVTGPLPPYDFAADPG